MIHYSSHDSARRRSAGSRSPGPSRTRSPGTTSAAGRSWAGHGLFRPSQLDQHVLAEPGQSAGRLPGRQADHRVGGQVGGNPPDGQRPRALGADPAVHGGPDAGWSHQLHPRELLRRAAGVRLSQDLAPVTGRNGPTGPVAMWPLGPSGCDPRAGRPWWRSPVCANVGSREPSRQRRWPHGRLPAHRGRSRRI